MHQRERGKRREIHNKLMELQARRRALVSHARPLGDIMSTVGSRCKQCVVCTGPQGNIRVVCRARPLVAVEIKSGEGVDVTSYPEGACVRVAGASRVDWFCANRGIGFFSFRARAASAGFARASGVNFLFRTRAASTGFARARYRDSPPAPAPASVAVPGRPRRSFASLVDRAVGASSSLSSLSLPLSLPSLSSRRFSPVSRAAS